MAEVGIDRVEETMSHILYFESPDPWEWLGAKCITGDNGAASVRAIRQLGPSPACHVTPDK